jgi:large subunit ribosomal protein L3
VTNKGLDLVRIDQEKNLVIVKGSVPGANGGYVIVKSSDKS